MLLDDQDAQAMHGQVGLSPPEPSHGPHLEHRVHVEEVTPGHPILDCKPTTRKPTTLAYQVVRKQLPTWSTEFMMHQCPRLI
jgi:hypothetical protein